MLSLGWPAAPSLVPQCQISRVLLVCSINTSVNFIFLFLFTSFPLYNQTSILCKQANNLPSCWDYRWIKVTWCTITIWCGVVLKFRGFLGNSCNQIEQERISLGEGKGLSNYLNSFINIFNWLHLIFSFSWNVLLLSLSFAWDLPCSLQMLKDLSAYQNAYRPQPIGCKIFTCKVSPSLAGKCAICLCGVWL